MEKRITIVNFVTDDKFIDGVIAYNEKFSPCNVVHIYVFVSDSPLEHFTLIKNESAITQLTTEEVIPFLLKRHADAVLLHSLYSLPLQVIPLIPSEICVIWSSWGYDIYSMMGTSRLVNMNLFRSLTKEFLGLTCVCEENCQADEIYQKAVQRVDFLSTVLPEEFNLIPSLPYFHAKELHYSYITPKDVDTYQNVRAPQITGENILVGNSGAPTNNHLDIFEKLSELEIGDRRIYCPLSYAGYPLEYKNKVLEDGKKRFGDNFIPFLQFLDKETYFSIVSSCKYAFFGHLRQQALGNIREMLVKGCKVFLDKDSPMYKHFKDRGVNVYSIQDDVTKKLFQSNIDQQDFHQNIIRMKSYTSPSRYYSEMSLIAKVITEHNYQKGKFQCFLKTIGIHRVLRWLSFLRLGRGFSQILFISLSHLIFVF